jgi:hypothetical protein
MPRITKKQREEMVAEEQRKIERKYLKEVIDYQRNNIELEKINPAAYEKGEKEIMEREEEEVHKLYLDNKLRSPYQTKRDIIEGEGMEGWVQYCRER